jgi:hypothetical protein
MNDIESSLTKYTVNHLGQWVDADGRPLESCEKYVFGDLYFRVKNVAAILALSLSTLIVGLAFLLAWLIGGFE